MAENETTMQGAPQQPAQQQSRCTGNCMACSILQRQYCASQLAYSNMRMLEQIQGEIASLQQNCKALCEKVDAIQNSEAMLIDPMEETDAHATGTEAIAQSGDGAESRSPEIINT